MLKYILSIYFPEIQDGGRTVTWLGLHGNRLPQRTRVHETRKPTKFGGPGSKAPAPAPALARAPVQHYTSTRM